MLGLLYRVCYVFENYKSQSAATEHDNDNPVSSKPSKGFPFCAVNLLLGLPPTAATLRCGGRRPQRARSAASAFEGVGIDGAAATVAAVTREPASARQRRRCAAMYHDCDYFRGSPHFHARLYRVTGRVAGGRGDLGVVSRWRWCVALECGGGELGVGCGRV